MFYFQTTRTVEENFFDMLSHAAGQTLTPDQLQIDEIVALDGNGNTAVTLSAKQSSFASGQITLTYNRINMNRLDDWPWQGTLAIMKPSVRTPESLLAAFNNIVGTNFSLDDLEPIDADAVPAGPLARLNFTARADNPVFFGFIYI